MCVSLSYGIRLSMMPSVAYAIMRKRGGAGVMIVVSIAGEEVRAGALTGVAGVQQETSKTASRIKPGMKRILITVTPLLILSLCRESFLLHPVRLLPCLIWRHRSQAERSILRGGLLAQVFE